MRAFSRSSGRISNLLWCRISNCFESFSLYRYSKAHPRMHIKEVRTEYTFSSYDRIPDDLLSVILCVCFFFVLFCVVLFLFCVFLFCFVLLCFVCLFVCLSVKIMSNFQGIFQIVPLAKLQAQCSSATRPQDVLFELFNFTGTDGVAFIGAVAMFAMKPMIRCDWWWWWRWWWWWWWWWCRWCYLRDVICGYTHTHTHICWPFFYWGGPLGWTGFWESEELSPWYKNNHPCNLRLREHPFVVEGKDPLKMYLIYLDIFYVHISYIDRS